MNQLIKIRIFYFIAFILMAVLAFMPAIPQDLAYHDFSDQRTMFGIPNFWNVISNLPFVVFGLWALVDLNTKNRQSLHPTLYYFVQIFFVGFLLTGVGSAYYHWSPGNMTLVWDRLPMTIAFMSFFAMMLALHVNLRLGARSLLPLILIGALSVFYWAYTEALKRGDLRLYAGVQFIPIVLIPLLIFLLPVKSYRLRYFIWLIVAYLSAKLFEHFDREIHAVIPMSGHAIKHVAASFSGLAFYFLVLSYSEENVSGLEQGREELPGV